MQLRLCQQFLRTTRKSPVALLCCFNLFFQSIYFETKILQASISFQWSFHCDNLFSASTTPVWSWFTAKFLPFPPRKFNCWMKPKPTLVGALGASKTSIESWENFNWNILLARQFNLAIVQHCDVFELVACGHSSLSFAKQTSLPSIRFCKFSSCAIQLFLCCNNKLKRLESRFVFFYKCSQTAHNSCCSRRTILSSVESLFRFIRAQTDEIFFILVVVVFVCLLVSSARINEFSHFSVIQLRCCVS